MTTRAWIALRTVTPTQANWNKTDDDSNSSAYWNDTDSYWLYRKQHVDANTKYAC